MEHLHSYLLDQINEANIRVPANAAENIEKYFDAIKPELKRFEKAAKETFEQVNDPRTNGAEVWAKFSIIPDEKNQASLNDAYEAFTKNPGKWTSKGEHVENAGRGYFPRFMLYVLVNDGVTYKLKFHLTSNTDTCWSMTLIVAYSETIDAAELSFTPNTSDKLKDIAGHTIEVGNSVAYCSRAVSGNSPMPVGVVTEVSPKSITVFDKINNNIVKIPGFKCCVITM